VGAEVGDGIEDGDDVGAGMTKGVDPVLLLD
jgi:hypothetical protein